MITRGWLDAYFWSYILTFALLDLAVWRLAGRMRY